MSYGVRVDAASFRFMGNHSNQEHERVFRMDSGFRIEHLRQRLAQEFHRAREGFDGHHDGDNLKRRFGKSGVKISTVRKIVGGYPEFREIMREGGWRAGIKERSRVEYDARKFPAEYVAMSDFRIFSDPNMPSTLDPGTYYKHRLSAEKDGTWGIIIDLELIGHQFAAICDETGESVPDEFFGALFLFNLFHEHFHYLTELAAIQLAGIDSRFRLYEGYLRNANWEEWVCDLEDCSKVIDKETQERKFVIQYPFGCKCRDQGILQAKTGYQYPVEEAMANAHASKQLMKVLKRENGWRQMMPYIEQYIKENHPLGYAEFDCFKATKRFQLGQRIMTRLLRGDVEMPRVNWLQHELIEGRSVSQVIRNEDELFTGLMRTENAYLQSIVSDDMAEIPVYIFNADKFPAWEAAIDRILCNGV